MVSYVATLPTDWAHEVVSDLVDALNVTFDRVTDTVALVPEGRSR